MDREEFDGMFDRVVDLPALDLSLQTDLPRILSPELERLRTAINEDDAHTLETAVDPALAQLDTPTRRAALARAVLHLRETGRVDTHLAAVAVIDLGLRHSTLYQSSIIHALAVSTGATCTPSGLLVVSR